MSSLVYAKKEGYPNICIEEKIREKLVRHFGRGTRTLYDIFKVFYKKKKNTNLGIGYAKAAIKDTYFEYKNECYIFIDRQEIKVALDALDSNEIQKIRNTK